MTGGGKQPVFKYGRKEIEALKGKDKILGAAMEQIGLIRRPVLPELFAALVNAIVGQQISTKAWFTVWGRMLERLSPITPQAVEACPVENLQACGLSMKKSFYIKEAATRIVAGEIAIDRLPDLTDDDVCVELTRLKGVGRWTAEMLLLFSLQRPDVFSFDDLAIHRGLRRLYRRRQVDRDLFEKYRRRYSPYGSVASLYLWDISMRDDDFSKPKIEKRNSGKGSA